MDFIDAGGPCWLACDVFTMRNEFDPCDHVPGGWRCETMVATFPWRARRVCPRSRRGGSPCRCHVAIAGWVLAGECASRSGRRRGRRTAAEADPVQLPSAAFRPLDGPARLAPVREAGSFTRVRSRVGNGVRDAGHDGNRVPSWPCSSLSRRRRLPRLASSQSSGSLAPVPLIVVGRCLARSSAQTHECLAWLSWSRPVPDLCGRIVTSFLLGVVLQYWNLAPFG